MAACANDERRAAPRRPRVEQRDPPGRLAGSEPSRPPARRTDRGRRSGTRSPAMPAPAPAAPRRSDSELPGGRPPRRSHAPGCDTSYSRDDPRTSRCRRSAWHERVEVETCSTGAVLRSLTRRPNDPALPISGAHSGPPLCPSERRRCPESEKGWAHRTHDHCIACRPARRSRRRLSRRPSTSSAAGQPRPITSRPTTSRVCSPRAVVAVLRV